MNRLRDFLTGGSTDNNDQDSSYRNKNNNNRHSNRPSNFSSRSRRRYNDNEDLYLSDDEDDWGMSAFSATQSSLRYTDNNNYGSRSGNNDGGGRRSSSAFWDQSSINNDNNIGLTDSDIDMAGGVGGGIRGEMEMPPSSTRATRGLQEWEREAIARDSLSDAFEIGDDDYYHSDHRRGSSSHHDTSSRSSSRAGGSSYRPRQQQPHVGHHTPLEEENTTAYDEVQEDIRSLEEGENDNISTASSNKDEVANAYRDYLKSIRDGGFESYLDNEDTINESPNFGGGGGTSEDEALDRQLDMEEERRASGSLYGNLYGVHDMRATDENSSPYSAWRAKAKALLRQEEERERIDAASPSRAILNKFRRKRSRDGIIGNGNNGRQNNNGYVDDISDLQNSSGISDKLYSYKRWSVMHNPRFRGVCICICLILALTAGLSYYGGQSSKNEQGDDGSGDLVDVPTKNNNDGTEFSQMNNPMAGQFTGGQFSDGSKKGPSDAIKNSLHTFDPVWYDRWSGWEGVTYIDTVNFCAAHDNRVPCPYEIYCSEGKDGDPFDGNRPNGEQWSPISNGANQWVSTGGMFTCQRYTDLHEQKKPDWGITGVSMDYEHGAGGITQNVLCCVDVHHIGGLDPFSEWGEKHGSELDQVDADNTQETTNSALVNVEDAENEKNPNEGNIATSQAQDLNSQKREKAVIAAFQPIWFSNAHGWSGTTYEDAILFCESYNHMVLCPYAAYCPGGRAKDPLPGSMVTKLDEEEWVPANGPMNTWVQIGTIGGDESTKCTLHHDIFGSRPSFGVDGSRADVKHHIMCCQM